jgi:hypothetical protein
MGIQGVIMRLLILLLLLLGCERNKPMNIQVGDCVIGEAMNIWKLIRMDEGKYMFATNPVEEGSQIQVVEDPSTFKKVECPK